MDRKFVPLFERPAVKERLSAIRNRLLGVLLSILGLLESACKNAFGTEHRAYIRKEVISMQYLWHFIIPAIMSVAVAYSILNIQTRIEEKKFIKDKIIYLNALKEEIESNSQFIVKSLGNEKRLFAEYKEPKRQMVLNTLTYDLTNSACSNLNEYFTSISMAERLSMLNFSVILNESINLANSRATSGITRESWEEGVTFRNVNAAAYFNKAVWFKVLIEQAIKIEEDSL